MSTYVVVRSRLSWWALAIKPLFSRAPKPNNYIRTVWPSGLRRWLQAPVRKGVGSNPTAVIYFECGLALDASWASQNRCHTHSWPSPIGHDEGRVVLVGFVISFLWCCVSLLHSHWRLWGCVTSTMTMITPLRTPQSFICCATGAPSGALRLLEALGVGYFRNHFEQFHFGDTAWLFPTYPPHNPLFITSGL